MNRRWIYSMLLYLLSFTTPVLADPNVVGFWKTVNEEAKLPECIIAVYEHDGKIYGRIVSTFDEQGKIETIEEAAKDIATGVKGNRPYVGLDIIWDLQKDDKKYTHGKILDPEKGSIYQAELWRENENLIVVGAILMFGRSQTWVPAQDSDFPAFFQKPDLSKLTPSIPEVN